MDFSDLFYIDATGVHTSDYPTVLSWLQGKYRDIYGADVYLEADSQDGQWVGVVSKALFDAGMYGASVYNSFSPSSAQGVGLSRNVKINGIDRQTVTYSTADLTIVGQAGTTLTGAQAIDTLNQKWDIPDGTVIPGGGTITVTATSDEAGAISAAANTINKIFTPTLGWQTVNNAALATEGQSAESDAELRVRQSQSTALPSLTVFDGTVGAVENVSGVTKARGYENDTGSTDSDGIPAHSICMVVEGGTIDDICQAIQIHKTPGTGTFGDTSAIVYDAHGMPLEINFQRPTPITIAVELTLATTTGWTSDYEALIAASVAEYINALRIGDDVLYSKLFKPSYLPSPAGDTYDISDLQVNGGSINIDIDFDELATCDPDVDVTFVIT